MRGTIAGLPVGVRMMLGLMTVGLFLILGLGLLEENKPILGWLLLGLATLRMVIWLRSLGKFLADRSNAEEEPPTTEPAPWTEERDEPTSGS